MAEKLDINPEQENQGQAQSDWDSMKEVPFAKKEIVGKIGEKLQGLINKAKGVLEKMGLPDRKRQKQIAEANNRALAQDPWSEAKMEGSQFLHRSYETLFNKVQNHERPTNEEITDAIGDGLSFGTKTYDGKADYQREALNATLGGLLDEVGDYEDFDVLSRPASYYDESGQKMGQTAFNVLFKGKDSGDGQKFKYLSVFRGDNGKGNYLVASLAESDHDSRADGMADINPRRTCRMISQGESGVDVMSFEVGNGASSETKEVGHFADPYASGPVMPQTAL